MQITLFNPCRFNEHVYVCGAGSKLIEAFAPLTNQFLSLALSFPESYPCTLYVHNSLLMVHSKTFISKLAELEGQLLLHSQVSQPAVGKYSNSHPILNSVRGVFFIIQEDKCVCLNMETGKLVRKFV